MVGVVVVFVSAGLVSYVRALTESGYATTADKTSAWMHDNHLGALVTVVETWLYSRHRPSRLAADPHQFHTNSGAAHASPLTLARLPIPVGGCTRTKLGCRPSRPRRCATELQRTIRTRSCVS